MVPVLSIALVLLVITILALNPKKQYADARNTTRNHDIALIADAIASYTNDYGKGLFYRIPTTGSIEICGDALTKNCDNLLDISRLLGTYLQVVPLDPNVESDGFTPNSRYFVERAGNHITVTAPDTEPIGSEDISYSR